MHSRTKSHASEPGFRDGCINDPVFAELLTQTSGKTVEALHHILAENKHQKHALELRARILLDAGDRRAAFRDLKTLLSVDPGNTWAKTQLDKGDGR